MISICKYIQCMLFSMYKQKIFDSCLRTRMFAMDVNDVLKQMIIKIKIYSNGKLFRILRGIFILSLITHIECVVPMQMTGQANISYSLFTY